MEKDKQVWSEISDKRNKQQSLDALISQNVIQNMVYVVRGQGTVQK